MDSVRAYLGFISTAFSQPSNLYVILQALALHAPSWLIALAKHAPIKRLRVLKEAKASSLAFARKLIQDIRAQPESLVDRHILSVLGTRVSFLRFSPLNCVDIEARATEPLATGKLKRMTEQEIYQQLTYVHQNFISLLPC